MSDAPPDFAPYDGDVIEPSRTTRLAPMANNPFAVAKPQGLALGATEIAGRSAEAEVHGRMLMAQRFPRDEAKAYARAMQSCQRIGFASAATWTFPRAGQSLAGPSIRLAEELARLWGNVEFGINELARKHGSAGLPGESEMEAYAWDLETNVRSSQRFTVKHLRDSNRGQGAPLTTERDIYEITANMGSRRVRARILAVLPPELVDGAVQACERTVAHGGGVSLPERIRAMVGKFSGYGVTHLMIADKLGHPIDQTTPDELVGLTSAFNSIKDGAPASEYFGRKGPAAQAALPAHADGFEAAAAGVKAPVKVAADPAAVIAQTASVETAALPEANPAVAVVSAVIEPDAVSTVAGGAAAPVGDGEAAEDLAQDALASLLDNLRKTTTVAALDEMLRHAGAQADIALLSQDFVAQGDWLNALDAHRARLSGKGKRS
ncbi:MAG: hypothetical protein ACRYGR_02330 [Janthinobacterium lividum]